MFSRDSVSSLNSYGYSPHPLATYLEWIQTILENDPNGSKPFIISITSSSPPSLATMLDAIQNLRAKLREVDGVNSRIAIELNTSCPNIKGSPPPSYDFPSLRPLLQVLAEKYWADETLTIGLKLPPYVYSTQFDTVVQGLTEFTRESEGTGVRNPFAFLTCTNTLGTSLYFSDQIIKEDGPDAVPGAYALPTAVGGLAGEPIHALSLGNVYTFRQLLSSHQDVALRDVQIIGVGGVTSPEALDRMHRAGASVVGSATLLGRQGVKAFEMLSAQTRVQV